MLKLAKWSVIVLAVVVAVLVIAWAAMPVTRYQTRVEIEAPADVVWDVFTDASRMGEWLSGYRSTEPISGDPLTPGSRFRMTFEENGREMVFEEEVLVVVANEEFSFRLLHPLMDGQHEVRLVPLGDARTALVTDSEVRGNGLFRLLVPLMRSSMIERQQGSYEKLADLVESEPVLYPDPEAGLDDDEEPPAGS